MRTFLHQNWVEIVAVFGIILGIIVVYQPFRLRRLFNQFVRFFQNQLSDHVNTYANRITPADLVGLLLVLLGIILILIRIRYRIISSPNWRKSTCPRCGSDLHRVHRTSFDRFLSRTLLPDAHRYLCTNKESGREASRP